jgi:hypothetical protein
LSAFGHNSGTKRLAFGSWKSVIFTVIFLSVATSTVISHSAFAGREINSRLSYGNAGAYCGGSGTKGMVWLTNDGSDYYSERVIVDSNTVWASVEVHGAVNSCSTPPKNPAYPNIQTWAVWVMVDGGSAGRLTITNTEFYRGNIPRSAMYAWSSGQENNPAGRLSASLNLAGIAPCSSAVNQIATGSTTVGISRRLELRQYNAAYRPPPVVNTLGSGTEYVTVPVTRNCPLDYNLNPSITVSPAAASTGTSVQPAPLVNNSGATSSSAAQWQVTTFTIAPGRPVPGGGLDGSVPTTHYGNGATVISSGNQAFPRGNQPLSAPAQTIADLPVGTKVCFALSVQPVTQANGSWSHSAPACVTVAKSPKVDVLGGDLNVGHSSVTKSNIITSLSNKSGKFYGSWGEYGIVPTGVVTGMASGSGYVGGATTGDICTLSILTFTVGGSGGGCGVVGNYVQTALAPNVSASFPITVPAASAGPGNPASPAVLPGSSISLIGNSLSGEYQAQAGVTAIDLVGGGDIPKGRSIIINAPAATVTIRGDIKYTGQPLGSMSDIPQVVIIAKNIIIADSVTNVDAWLVATGTGTEGKVNTCGAGGVSETSDLVYTQCNQKLTVNGPVIANHLIMRRTAGSGTGAQSGDPAEVFNLRADAYIWASNYNLKSGRITTAVVTELPPRF